MADFYSQNALLAQISGVNDAEQRYGRGLQGKETKEEQKSQEGSHTLVVVYDIPKVVSTTVVSFAHTHGIVREVDIAVITCRAGALGGLFCRGIGFWT